MRLNSNRSAIAAAVLVLIFVSVSVATGQEMYAGRAVGARLQMHVAPQPTMYADTGELPPEGGKLSISVERLAAGPTLSASDVSSLAQGDGGTARASSSLSNVVILDGQPALVTASSVLSEASVGCTKTVGSTVIVNLRVRGVPVAVSTAPNQKHVIPGVGTLVVNEQIAVGETREITVNALHLIQDNGEHVIVASAHAGVGCVVATQAATWQSVKQLYRD
jgi:hypothetical protein